MEVSVFTAILVALWAYYINSSFTAGVGFFVMMKPLFSGTVVGLIMGDVTAGLQIGATINLINLGYISVGGAVPSDLTFSGVIGTALAIAGNLEPEVALTLALPLGLIGGMAWNFRMTIDSFFVRKAEDYARKGNISGVAMMNLVPGQLILFAFYAIPTFFAVYFGAEAVGAFVQYIPVSIIKGLSVVGGLLPALGIAQLMKFMMNKKIGAFFFIGFLLATYLGMDLMSIALIFGCVAFVVFQLQAEKDKEKEESHA